MRLRQTLMVLFSWLLVAALAAQTPPAASPTDCPLCVARRIPCPTCAGNGTMPVDCAFCDGDGEIQCVACAAHPRWLPCPNTACRQGRVLWDTKAEDACRLCSAKGQIPCPVCREDKARPCVVCAGTGKRLRPCWTCTGEKDLPCPLCTLDPAKGGCSTCPGAAGTRLVACGLCGHRASGKAPCLRCDGRGDAVCARCCGLAKVACGECSGTGRKQFGSPVLPGVPNSPREKAGSKPCRLCEGRGVRSCPDCAKGRLRCGFCDQGLVPDLCAPCLHEGMIGCDECLSGGTSRWTLLGGYLLERGHAARAVQFFDRALAMAKGLPGLTENAALSVRLLLDEKQAEDRMRGMQRRDPAVARARADGRRILPPAFVRLEQCWPLDMQKRYWPDPPAGLEHAPWLDKAWLEAHTGRVVARLAAARARALAVAGK